MKIRKAKIYTEGLTAKDTKTIKKLFNVKKVEKEKTSDVFASVFTRDDGEGSYLSQACCFQVVKMRHYQTKMPKEVVMQFP